LGIFSRRKRSTNSPKLSIASYHIDACSGIADIRISPNLAHIESRVCSVGNDPSELFTDTGKAFKAALPGLLSWKYWLYILETRTLGENIVLVPSGAGPILKLSAVQWKKLRRAW
jgi:hypothetical protein